MSWSSPGLVVFVKSHLLGQQTSMENTLMEPSLLCRVRLAKWIPSALFLMGLSLLVYSALLRPYSNEGEFQQRYYLALAAIRLSPVTIDRPE